jgi:serine/threonine-protein kinase
MSDVFVALHRGLRRRVALKLLRPSLRHDSAAVQRFLREGECAARVCHPNVVDVLDVGMEQGIAYLVMELLEGETLERRLARVGRFDLTTAVDLVLPIFDGVAATHAAGVVHRDIKPSNVLLARMPDGSVVPKLVDFGIATLEERRGITGALGPIGTPHYMSPEQARGERNVDERSDQYSLASMLYEMLTGSEPFEDGDVSAVMARVARGKFPKLRDARKDLPEALDEVLARATAYDPARRFESVSAFAEALLPFACERTRKLWVSRHQRAGMPGAQLLSGSYRGELAGERTRVTPVCVRRDAARPRRTFTPTFAALGCCLLMAGLGIGHLRSRSAADAELMPADAPMGQPFDVAGTAALTGAPRRVYVTPRDALITLDGTPVGQGDFLLEPLNDDEVHELRITASGHVPRVLLFRRTLDTAHIALEPLKLAER